MPSYLSKAILAGLLANAATASVVVSGSGSAHVNLNVELSSKVKQSLKHQGCGCNDDVTITAPYLGPTQTATYISPCGGQPGTHFIQVPLITDSACQSPPPPPTSIAISTPTTTTTTPTQSSSPPPAAVPSGACAALSSNCVERGFSVDYYWNPIGGDSPLNTEPWYYYITNKLQKLASSVTQGTFFVQNYPPNNIKANTINGVANYPGWQREVNGITVNANNFTLVYSGFYQAPETGSFTLCATADNQNDLFFGNGNAFDCTNGNVDTSEDAKVTSRGANYINNEQCISVMLQKNAYYPIRSVMKNWGGPSAFNMTIQRPGETRDQASNFFGDSAYPMNCGNW